MRSLEHQYLKDDLVYVKNESRKTGVSPKLQPVWDGPYVVTNVLGPVVYEITGRRRCFVIHHDRLKPYKSEVVPAWVQKVKHDITSIENVSLDVIHEEENVVAPAVTVQEGNAIEEAPSEPCSPDGSLRSNSGDNGSPLNVGRVRQKPAKLDL
ncbi:uncharacterized protein LOC117339017 [Pecten maximus]|uniref:uncharacterized protein LOC117339017 n=1 Tax=Pecten maximus TaxID=6579 RepID=UPI0014580A5E|nr:uncharacterized protein LOC117339017 [Pecten maximus]